MGIETVTEMEERLGVGRERYRNAERGLGLGLALAWPYLSAAASQA